MDAPSHAHAAAPAQGRARARRALVLCAATLGSLGLAEGLARLRLPAQPTIRLEQFAEVVGGRHGMPFESAFEGDPELFWRLAPDVTLASGWPLFGVLSNAQGLREDHAIALSPAPGELRILFVGDSVTFGYGLGLAETFVEQTERELARRFPNSTIECINAGVPGWTLFQGLRWLETEGLALAPALVVVNFGWNAGTPWDGLGDLEHHARRAAREPPPGLGWSALARIALDAFAPRIDARDGPNRPRLTPDEFAHLLAQTEGVVRAAGADFFVFVGAARTSCEGGERRLTALQQIQLAFGDALRFGPDGGPAVLDGVRLSCELSERRTLDELYFDGIHPTARSNRHIARALAERFTPWLRARGAR